MERSSGMPHGGSADSVGLSALLIPLSAVVWHWKVGTSSKAKVTVCRTQDVTKAEATAPTAQAVPIHVGIASFAGMLLAGLIIFMIGMAVGVGMLLFVDYLERSIGSTLASVAIRFMAYLTMVIDLLLFVFYVASAVYLRLRAPSVKTD
ncbi:hypothetical protein [Caballeronia sp. J97]|uniref:hypothetical protein n=1 Tax=Caballeronia sp. J97 TaxID=2805429 RepID=UPI002AB2A516|nr:hypothetical protein [Caballeronia sp. J97]